MVAALIGMSGSAHGAPPPNRPTITSLPPLGRTSKPSAALSELPTRSMTPRTGPSAARVIWESASAARPSIAASAPHSSAARRLRASTSTHVDHDRALAAERLQDGQGHQAEPAGANHHDGLRRDQVAELFQRAVGGHAGAGVWRSADR